MTHRRPIEHFTAERDRLVALPPEPFDTDRVMYRRVSKDCVIRVDTNDYSVPWRTAQRYQREPIPVRLDGEWVHIWDGGPEVSRHPRCYGRHQQITIAFIAAPPLSFTAHPTSAPYSIMSKSSSTMFDRDEDAVWPDRELERSIVAYADDNRVRQIEPATTMETLAFAGGVRTHL